MADEQEVVEQEPEAAAPKIPDVVAVEIFDVRREVRKAFTALESAKANASSCKKEHDAAVGKLLSLIDDVERPLPLFDPQTEDDHLDELTCPNCGGSGRDVDDPDSPCGMCAGLGKIIDGAMPPANDEPDRKPEAE